MTSTREASTRARRTALPTLATLAALLALPAGCRQGGSATTRSASSPDDSPPLARSTVPACATDSLHPVAAAPAAGLWLSERDGRTPRVSAMVGPSAADGDRARITRRVETLEQRPDAPPLRLGSDTASVELELLPPFGAGAASAGADATPRTEPAAVYAVGPLVLLASYEPCDASAGEPRIRYLRRDQRGAVATDLMLRRVSSAAGALP